jgi:4'-phosphopantetheinyl transferase
MSSDYFEEASNFQLPDRLRNIVQVWQVKISDIYGENLLRQYKDMLSFEEHAKYQSFFRPKDRHRYLVTRALARTTLSRFAKVNPPDWRFGDNGYGRPTLVHRHSHLCFNIAHSGDWVVMALGNEIDIGIDVEYCRGQAPIELADQFFAKPEALDLRRLAANEQPSRFFELWTLKESYIKARGLGLSIPLHSFAFDLQEPKTVALSQETAFKQNTDDWRFVLWRIDADHVASLCFRAPARRIEVVWRYAVPLENETWFRPAILRQTPSLDSR